jgi:hypothetical protein
MILKWFTFLTLVDETAETSCQTKITMIAEEYTPKTLVRVDQGALRVALVHIHQMMNQKVMKIDQRSNGTALQSESHIAVARHER